MLVLTASSGGGWKTYNCAVSWGDVDIEDELKPGHCVEPEREMQLCAREVAENEARNTRSVNGFIFINRYPGPHSALIPIQPTPSLCSIAIDSLVLNAW